MLHVAVFRIFPSIQTSKFFVAHLLANRTSSFAILHPHALNEMAEGPSYFSTAGVMDMLKMEVEEQTDDIYEPMCEGSENDFGADIKSDEEDR